MNRLITILIFILLSGSVHAAPSGVTYQGRILKPNGEPLTGSNVQFRMQIRAPDANGCLMYEELQSQNMSSSAGSFSVTMNDGSGVRQDTTGLGFDRVFANRGTITFDPATCASGNDYVAGSGDGRVLQVYFKDETMAAWEPMPPQKINFVPFAFEAKQIAGFGAQNLLRFAEADGTLVNTTPLNNAQYTELLALLNGTSTAFERAGRLGGVALPTLGAGQAGQVLGWNGTAWETTSTVPSNSIDTGKIQDLAVTSAKIANGTIVGGNLATNIAINTSGAITTSGTVSSNVSTARDFRFYDQDANPNENYISFRAPVSLPANYSFTWPSGYGSSNQVLTTDGTGTLTWAAPGVSSQWSNGSTAGQIYYSGGNVGINNSAPGAALTVNGYGGANAGSAIAVFNNSVGHGRVVLWDEGLNTSPAAGPAMVGGGGASGFGVYAVNGPLRLYAGTAAGVAQERARFDGATGDLGIGLGAATPNGKLDVKGSIVMSGATSGYAGFRVPAAAGSSVWQLPAADGASGQALVTDGSGALSWSSMVSVNYWTKTLSDLSYVAGNVGIGTATPNSTLEVSAPTNATLLVTNTNPTANPSSSIALKNYRGYWGGGDPSFVMYAANGTPSSPGPLLQNQLFLNIEGRGFSEAGYWDGQPSSYIRAYASNNWGGGGYKPSYMTFGTSLSEQMRITANGNVGIGLTAPSEKLEVSGNVKATNFVSTSDARLKKNVVKTPGLDYILKLTGVEWRWKSDNRTDAGVIAQDVERVMPYAVVTDAKSGFKAVKYNALVAPLIESTKEIYGLCREQKEAIRTLSSELSDVQSELRDVKLENAQLKRDMDLIKKKLGL